MQSHLNNIQTLPPLEKSVFLGLLEFYNWKAGSAWPKQETLAITLGLSRKVINRVIKKLREVYRLITTQRIAQRSCLRYRLTDLAIELIGKCRALRPFIKGVSVPVKLEGTVPPVAQPHYPTHGTTNITNNKPLFNKQSGVNETEPVENGRKNVVVISEILVPNQEKPAPSKEKQQPEIDRKDYARRAWIASQCADVNPRGWYVTAMKAYHRGEPWDLSANEYVMDEETTAKRDETQGTRADHWRWVQLLGIDLAGLDFAAQYIDQRRGDPPHAIDRRVGKTVHRLNLTDPDFKTKFTAQLEAVSHEI